MKLKGDRSLEDKFSHIPYIAGIFGFFVLLIITSSLFNEDFSSHVADVQNSYTGYAAQNLAAPSGTARSPTSNSIPQNQASINSNLFSSLSTNLKTDDKNLVKIKECSAGFKPRDLLINYYNNYNDPDNAVSKMNEWTKNVLCLSEGQIDQLQKAVSKEIPKLTAEQLAKVINPFLLLVDLSIKTDSKESPAIYNELAKRFNNEKDSAILKKNFAKNVGLTLFDVDTMQIRRKVLTCTKNQDTGVMECEPSINLLGEYFKKPSSIGNGGCDIDDAADEGFKCKQNLVCNSGALGVLGLGKSAQDEIKSSLGMKPSFVSSSMGANKVTLSAIDGNTKLPSGLSAGQTANELCPKNDNKENIPLDSIVDMRTDGACNVAFNVDKDIQSIKKKVQNKQNDLVKCHTNLQDGDISSDSINSALKQRNCKFSDSVDGESGSGAEKNEDKTTVTEKKEDIPKGAGSRSGGTRETRYVRTEKPDGTTIVTAINIINNPDGATESSLITTTVTKTDGTFSKVMIDTKVDKEGNDRTTVSITDWTTQGKDISEGGKSGGTKVFSTNPSGDEMMRGVKGVGQMTANDKAAVRLALNHGIHSGMPADGTSDCSVDPIEKQGKCMLSLTGMDDISTKPSGVEFSNKKSGKKTGIYMPIERINPSDEMSKCDKFSALSKGQFNLNLRICEQLTKAGMPAEDGGCNFNGRFSYRNGNVQQNKQPKPIDPVESRASSSNQQTNTKNTGGVKGFFSKLIGR